MAIIRVYWHIPEGILYIYFGQQSSLATRQDLLNCVINFGVRQRAKWAANANSWSKKATCDTWSRCLKITHQGLHKEFALNDISRQDSWSGWCKWPPPAIFLQCKCNIKTVKTFWLLQPYFGYLSCMCVVYTSWSSRNASKQVFWRPWNQNIERFLF